MNVRVFRAEVPLWAAFSFQPVFVLLLVVWCAWAACRCFDLRVACSASVPLGIYRIDPSPVARGDYVMFCPPQAEVFVEALRHFWIAQGDCAVGSRHLIKVLVAVEGDHVLFREHGVFVNGRRVPNSPSRARDARGVTLPRPPVREAVLGRDEQVFMSLKSPDSFDARYFGLIKGNVVCRLEPVLTWEM